MNLVTAAQMKMAEDAANAHGVSYDAMMENAGRATAEAIDEQFRVSGRRVLVLVGPGNNGGDGLVAARYLTDLGALVSVYVWKRKNLDNDPNWGRLAVYRLPVVFWDDDSDAQQLKSFVENAAVVVDALLGTGVSRPIAGGLADLLSAVRAVMDARRVMEFPALTDPIDPPTAPDVGPAVVAVDMPSGVHTDSGAVDPLTLPADMTVTFAAPKRGQVLYPGAAFCGHLLIADIEIAESDFEPELPQLLTPADVSELIPPRPEWAHKGSFGKLLVVAGSKNFVGAAALAARAAYRTGAGLVTVATPAPVQPMVANRVPEATFIPLPHDDGGIALGAAVELRESLERVSAVLLGPGLGTGADAHEFIGEFLVEYPVHLPLILDADALNLLAEFENWWEALPPETILTPHPGEMSRLTGKPIAVLEANRLEIVPQMAQKWGATVVYKGAYSIIADADGSVAVLPFANPALATAGSGDVLAGAIAGLVAQDMIPANAVRLGAYLHGLAGELAREKFWSAGVLAGDLPPLLPLALRELNGV